MMRGSLRNVSIGAWLIALGAGQVVTGQARTGSMVLAIDAPNSQVLIQVGKAGLFGFAGHAHEVAATGVRGRVVIDPADLPHASVRLEFAAAALRLTGRGEPPADVAAVQKVMLSEAVLDVARFPTIVFSSRRVSVTARTSGTAEVSIEGDMTLHGVARPMTIRASVTLDPGGRISARGSFVLKQTDFGMVPVTAAGGSVRVKDELDIQFVLRTRPSDEPRTTQ
jgi:polyisoprenoid-binding protein YceI